MSTANFHQAREWAKETKRCPWEHPYYHGNLGGYISDLESAYKDLQGYIDGCSKMFPGDGLLAAKIEKLRETLSKEDHEVCQILGKVLGYPKLFPEASQVDDGEVCTSDHIPVTLAVEAAKEIESLKRQISDQFD